MSFAGFWYTSPSAEKLPEWNAVDHSLKFYGYLSAYSKGFPTLAKDDSLSLDMLVQSEPEQKSPFSTLLEIYDTENKARVVVAQWKQKLMILDSDDFDNKKKKPKIYANLAPMVEQHRIVIQSDWKGTKVYINGELRGTNKKLHLVPPKHPNSTYLLLGNNIGGNASWLGSFHQLSISNRAQANENATPNLLYRFANGNTQTIADDNGLGFPLTLQKKPQKFTRDILTLPKFSHISEAWFWKDALLNFFGFVPFGGLLYLILQRSQFFMAMPLLLLVTLAGFLFSLLIEMSQTVIPMRNSSMLDLLLNTAGAGMGAFVAKGVVFFKRSNTL